MKQLLKHHPSIVSDKYVDYAIIYRGILAHCLELERALSGGCSAFFFRTTMEINVIGVSSDLV
jgi:hypothetical protein